MTKQLLAAALALLLLTACQPTPAQSSSAPATSATSSSAPASLPAFTQTAQGDPVVTVSQAGQEKRYLSFSQTEEVVFAPLATEEYSLPNPWMDSVYQTDPAPNQIDGLRIENPYATLYLNAQTLVIEHPNSRKEIDLFSIITGEDYPKSHAIFERQIWFYQQDELVTLFFVQMNERTFLGDTHVIQLNVKTDELMADQMFGDNSLSQLFWIDDQFYLFCSAGQTGEYLLHVLQSNLIPLYQPGQRISPANWEQFEQDADGQVLIWWNDEQMTVKQLIEKTAPT